MWNMETQSIPKGFKINRDAHGDIEVEYRSTGIGGLVLFLVVAVGGLTFGCAYSAYEVYNKYGDWVSFLDAILGVPWWGWIGLGFMAFFPLAFGIILLWFVFGQTRFRLSDNGLWVQKHLFFWRSTNYLPAEAMRWVRQEKDGGRKMDDDSYATWKLVMKADRVMELLWKQPIDKSDWLGQVLAEKYNIPFFSSEERE
jgi:hypothetical protein